MSRTWGHDPLDPWGHGDGTRSHDPLAPPRAGLREGAAAFALVAGALAVLAATSPEWPLSLFWTAFAVQAAGLVAGLLVARFAARSSAPQAGPDPSEAWERAQAEAAVRIAAARARGDFNRWEKREPR